jgi:energy-coupling factor transporter ATP-binding protein EcfA2
MSPRKGGESDKVGNRYETAWTVRQLLYIVAEKADAITLEAIGEIGEGSEFTFEKGAEAEAHQVKRQHGAGNTWSIATLTSKGIIENGVQHVGAGRAFYFVSTVPSAALAELAVRARQATDLKVFKSSWLTSKDLVDEFAALAASKAVKTEENAWALLQNLWMQVVDERELVATNAVLAESKLEGAEGSVVCDALGSIALNNLGVRIDRRILLAQLEAKEIRPRTTAARTAAVTALNVCNESWKASIERELLDPVILRPEAQEVYDATLTEKQVVLVTGQAGGGKSGLLRQVSALLDDADIPYLGFRLDRLDQFTTTTELGRQIGLEISPVAALATTAQERECVLIVDQLDAVSLASGRMPQFFDTIAELVREAKAFPSMRVILACRGFDVENDHRILSLVSKKTTTRVDIQGLTEEQVDGALTTMGLSPARFDSHQRSLLKIPFNLVLLSAISHQPGASEFRSTKQLLDAFWTRKLRLCKQRQPAVRFQQTIDAVAKAASERQRLSVPISILDHDDLLHDAGTLESEHILARSDQMVSFFHETFFDYAFARAWVSQPGSLVEFLKAGEQELFRRGQVRQILGHLHEVEPSRFVREVNELLQDESVRYHIKQVVIDILRGLQNPSASEWEMIESIRSTTPALSDRLRLSLRTMPWFELLLSEGMLAELLSSGEQDDQSLAIEVIASAGDGHRPAPRSIPQPS